MKKFALLFAGAFGLLVSACSHSPSMSGGEVKTYEAQANWDFRQPQNDTGHAHITFDTHGGRNSAVLPRCGGTASLFSDGSKWWLKVSNSQCANLVINDASAQKMDGEGQVRSADVWMTGASDRAVTHKIVIRSNSGKNSDTIRVTIRPSIPTARNGDWVRLSDCGGDVQVVVQNGQVNLKFKDVRSCNIFDIVSDNGETTVYPAKEFPGSSASFTLPKRVMEFGFNRVLIQVRSKSGWIEDKFYVSFVAL